MQPEPTLESPVPPRSRLARPAEPHGYGDPSQVVSTLLVNLRADDYPVRTAPTALVTLGASARAALGDRIRLNYFDRQIEDLAALDRMLRRRSPQLVGLSGQFGTRADLDASVATIREASPAAVIVVGNVTGTYAVDAVLADHPDVVCCVGRGEETLVRILENLAAGSDWAHPNIVPNVAFVDRIGRTMQSEARAVPSELVCGGDWSGYFAAYPHELYEEVWVEASRGCPQKRGGIGCTYCAILPDAGSRDWAPRPLDVVVEDLRQLVGVGVRHLRFADEEFMAHRPAHALEFADAVAGLWRELDAASQPLPTFDVAMRVDDVARAHPGQSRIRPMVVGDRTLHISPNELRRHALERMKALGLRQIYLGVESGSAAQLKRMRKAATPEGNELAIATLRDLGIQAACGWIMFDPFLDGAADLVENCAFIERNRLLPSSLTDDFVTNPVNRMRVLAGTPLLAQVRDLGLLGDVQPDGVEYEFRYADPRIAALIAAIEGWEEGCDRPGLYELKNAVAHQALSRGHETDRARIFFELKALDFAVCRSLVAQLARSTNANRMAQVFEIPDELQLRRQHLLEPLRPATTMGLRG